MDRQYVQTLRVGITAVLFALVFRLAQPDTVSFPEPQKTGPDVRFSPSFGTGFPGFVESPPPAVPKADEPALPVFSGEEDIALYYACSVEPDVTALLEKPLRWDLRQEEPTVLILSTTPRKVIHKAVNPMWKPLPGGPWMNTTICSPSATGWSGC